MAKADNLNRAHCTVFNQTVQLPGLRQRMGGVHHHSAHSVLRNVLLAYTCNATCTQPVLPQDSEVEARRVLDVARRRLAAVEGNRVARGGDAAEVDAAWETFSPPIR